MPKPLSPHEQLEAAGQRRVFQMLLDNHVIRSCLNCEHWTDNQCALYKSVPPPKVIMFSCVEEWEPDVPF